jgi:hypothetical protein
MLILKGKLLNVFMGNSFTKEDGTVVPPKHKLQLLTKVPLKNGATKNQLIDLSIPAEKVAKYKGKENTDVEVEVALMGKCTFYGV